MKKVLIYIGITLIIIGGVGSFVLREDFFDRELAEKEVQFDASEIKRIHVGLETAKINVLPTNDKQITVEWTFPQHASDSNDLDVKQKGDTIQVSSNYEQRFMTPILRMWRSSEANMTIHVPAEHSFEELHIRTDVSDVQIKDTLADELVVRSSVGDIDIDGFRGKVEIRNEIGQVDLRSDRIVGDIDVRTEIGMIDLQLAEQQKDLDIFGNSSIGSVKIFGISENYRGSSPDFIIDLKSEIGDIKVEAAN